MSGLRLRCVANFRKHGITFDQAIGVFYDPMVVTIEDERFADEAARAYLEVIMREPALVRAALARQGDAA